VTQLSASQMGMGSASVIEFPIFTISFPAFTLQTLVLSDLTKFSVPSCD